MSTWISKNISANEAGAEAIHSGPMVTEADVAVLSNGNIVVAQISATADFDPHAIRHATEAEIKTGWLATKFQQYDISYEGRALYTVSLSLIAPDGTLIKRVASLEPGLYKSLKLVPGEDGFDVRPCGQRGFPEGLWRDSRLEIGSQPCIEISSTTPPGS